MNNPLSKLILGTVQMGLDYGINNKIGKISLQESHQILLKAHSSGITTLDTAEAYGNAHKVIGEFHKNNPNHIFNIVTKVPHSIEADSIENKINQYIEDLEVKSLDVLMFHSFDSFKNNLDSVENLLELKSKGLIKHLGVSLYTNEQMEYLLDKDYISVVQLPFNLLDNYSLRGELINQLKNKGKIIHTRSAFLQGLFFKNVKDENSIVQQLQTELELLQHIILKSNCTMEELALSYCLHQADIDNLIIGVDSINHLESNINASTYAIKEEVVDKINSIKIENVNLLNPSLW
jgi:aryl-alcohol dehydrogenase-like predicted oxidoreductase